VPVMSNRNIAVREPLICCLLSDLTLIQYASRTHRFEYQTVRSL
jgi:hypothetical protein